MGDLLKEIKHMSKKAADALKQAGFETDRDIQSLTREDLHELLPGVENLRLRKDVFNMIHIPRPANMLLKELEELLNNLDSSAQIDPVVFIDHIRFIKEQLVNVQLLLKDNVDLLKTINTRQLDSKAEKGSLSTIEDHPQGAQGGSKTSAYFQEVTVKYKMVVAGETFGAHTQLMDQVKRATKGNVRLLENSQDSQIIIVFCPITTRPDSDVKAAMTGVPGDKPIILVKMHHACESRSSLCFSTLSDDRNIVLQVNVFYHVNCGLLKCKLNEKAVDEIQKELLKHSDHRSTDTRASTAVQNLYNLAKDYVDVGLGGTTDGARCQEGNI